MSSQYRIIPPAAEPVTLDELRDHLRITHTDEDSDLERMISGARQECENHTGRALITQTWEMRLDTWPCDAIRLSRQPVQSVESVSYLDGDGVAQMWDVSGYRLTGWENSYLRTAHAIPWPDARCDYDAITVRYVAGYGNAPADVPADLRQWILVRAGTLYAFREQFLAGQQVSPVGAFDGLLDAYRLF